MNESRNKKRRRFTVAHVLRHWLKDTQNWIYHQISHVPDAVKHVIICQKEQYEKDYYMPNIRSYESDSWGEQLWIRLREKLGFEDHVNFFQEQLEEIEPDLVHSHFGPVGWEVQKILPSSMKHAVSFYGYDIGRLPSNNPEWNERYDELFRQVDRVLCEGPHMADRLQELGCPWEKLQIHHLGINRSDIPFVPRSVEEHEPVKILLAGRFCEKKGIPYGLRAIGNVADNHNVRVTLIGEGEKNETERIQSVLDENNMHSYVERTGFLPHDQFLHTLYKHHVFLAPSVEALDGDIEGGVPMAVIEAAASGMPVIATEHCDIPVVIQHQETGLLVEERDVEGLTDNLRWLLDHPENWSEITAGARELIENEFDAQEQGTSLYNQYRQLLDTNQE